MFNLVLFMDWQFVSGCFPPRLSTTQLPSTFGQPVFCPAGTFTQLLVCTLRRTKGAFPTRPIVRLQLGLPSNRSVWKTDPTVLCHPLLRSGIP